MDLSSRENTYSLMGLSGLEPPTSRLSGVRSNQLSYKPILKSFDFSGDEEIRTLDPLLARQVLSQLSYAPSINKQSIKMVGLRGLGPLTSRLSGVRSNQLSYKPTMEMKRFELSTPCLQGRCSPN